MWYGHDGMGWWMVFGTIWVLLFWGALIGLVVWAVNRLTERHPAAPTPLEIARERYARGEISREEYEQMRQALER